ncbi:MAG: S8 family serine peptidase, partial [Actinomycetota bacterium]|nr:S8 family serine peptidase [Actinomycetota bacterium]
MRRTTIGICAVVCVVAATVLPASARPRSQARSRPILTSRSTVRSDAGGHRIPGELVVGYRKGVTRAATAALRDEVDAELVERTSAHLEVVQVDGGVAAATAEIAADPDVAFVEPNYIYRTAAIPNDARFSLQWGLNNTGQAVAGSTGTADADIDAPEAWDVTTGSDDIVVAVADTGVALNHPDLAPNIWTNPGETGGGKENNGKDDDANGYVDDWQGWDFVGNDNRPTDLVGHGTHVAGIIGAQGGDGLGVAGVNWNVKIMPLKVLGDNGAGSTAHVAAAFDYARANGALVVNASLGGPDASTAVAQAVANASETLFVSAAGNEAKNNDATASYPCNTPAPNMVCVAASDQSDNLAGFSNYGAASVDLAAPGTRILNAQPAFARMMSETFEADMAATWVTGGTGKPWGRAVDNYGYYVTDSPTGNYAPNTNSWLATSQATDLAGEENCRLSFVLRLAMDAKQDVLHVEASVDGASWSSLDTYTGSSKGAWVSASQDLSAYDDGPIYVRFRTASNALFEDDGASIDDVSIRCLAGTYAGSEYAYFSGTSMATPYVAGAAALLAAAAPDASVSSLHNALIRGVDVIPAMAG